MNEKTNYQGPERRRHSRVKKNLPIKISTEDVDLVTETKDISASGAYCFIEKPIAFMTKLKITLLLPHIQKNKPITKKIECEGVVVRTKEEALEGKKDNYAIAIMFTNLRANDEKKIIRYIDHQIKNPLHNSSS